MMIRFFTLLLGILLLTVSAGQAQTVFCIDSLPAQGILLNKGWTWHAGDNPDWAKPGFDDSKWEGIDPTTEIAYLPQFRQAEIGWFRLRLSVSRAVLNQSLAVLIGQVGASEIYLNGRLIYRFGVVSAEYAQEQTYHLYNAPFALKFDAQASQVLAVRYSFNRRNFYINYLSTNPVVRFTLKPANKAFAEYAQAIRVQFGQLVLMCSLYLVLSLMYIVLYGSFRAEKAFLWIGIYLFGSSLHYACFLLTNLTTDTSTGSILLFIGDMFNASGALFAIFASYVMFGRSRGWFWWFLVGYVLCTLPVLVWSYRWGATFALSFYVIGTTTNLWLMYQGIRNGRVGAWALFGGLSIFYVMYFAVIWPTALGQNDQVFHVGTISIVAIPIGYAIFLAIEFARTSRSLQARVVEVETLSAQTIAQELEKQQILTIQNETLELQVSERTAELSHKNEELVVEAALERVRTQSMAMQHSDHLQAVITVVSEQLQGLGFQFHYVNFVVVRTDRGWDCYNAIPNGDILSFLIPYVDHRLFSQSEEVIQQGLNFFTYALNPDENSEWNNYLFTHTILKDAPEEYKRFIMGLPSLVASVVVWPDIALSIAAYSGIPFTDTENAIFKRFGAVFGQAYTRFKDLKKAEEQAREAIRTASLDRVRAEIASMRTTRDLERITPLIWAELTTLQVPFFRCGVFIVNEAQQRIQAFLSTPDGHSRTQLNLPIDQTATSQQIVQNWQHQRTYTDRWSHDQLQQWATSMVEEGQIDSLQEYEVVDEVKEAFSLQFVPFKQGMLYVGSLDPLTLSQMDLTQSLADAFSVAYARYEDFRQLEEAKSRVDITLTELKATQAQLIQKEKMASLGELTAGIAHEIQNPLNFVNNFSEVSAELVTELEEEQLKPDRDPELEAELLGDLKQNLQKITHHGGRASAIVRGMLEHSRSSTGERQPTNLNALADEYLRLAYQGLRSKLKDFNCELITDFDPDLGRVSVVPSDIGRVLLNLFNNGFYAVSERSRRELAGYKPTIWLTTERLDNTIQLRVRDNGTGIPDAVKAKIFQPFFTTKPTGEGTGLGLSLSYDIVTKGHGGALTVESVLGEGTELVVELPI